MEIIINIKLVIILLGIKILYLKGNCIRLKFNIITGKNKKELPYLNRHRWIGRIY